LDPSARNRGVPAAERAFGAPGAWLTPKASLVEPVLAAAARPAAA
jgi:hypothetical protein